MVQHARLIFYSLLLLVIPCEGTLAQKIPVAPIDSLITVVSHLCPATHPFFGGDFYHTGCTSRTVLCGFGSVFQDGKTLNIRRVNGGKHTQVAKYSVDDNQRVVAAGQ